MLDAIAAIKRRQPASKAAFDAEEMVQVWMLRHIQIIGEAAAGITRETRALAGTIPWGQIVGMRNALVHACWCTPTGARLLVHAYFNIDWDAVWLVVIRDLPQLEPDLGALAATLAQRQDSTSTPPPNQ
jgi:uncharacterized protein with HEPN domain